LKARHDVKGFPTLKFYDHGKMKDYTGGRTEDTIYSWVKKATMPPSSLVESCDVMEAKS